VVIQQGGFIFVATAVVQRQNVGRSLVSVSGKKPLRLMVANALVVGSQLPNFYLWTTLNLFQKDPGGKGHEVE